MVPFFLSYLLAHVLGQIWVIGFQEFEKNRLHTNPYDNFLWFMLNRILDFGNDDK